MRTESKQSSTAAASGVILINGMSGAGKTTLARRLAPLLGLPLFSKDDFKEAFYDFGPRHDFGSEGHRSRFLGALAQESLWTAAAALPLSLLESYWHAERDRDFVLAGLSRNDLTVRAEVFCQLDPVLARSRAASRERHRVHPRLECDEAGWAEGVRGAVPLGLGPLLVVDTGEPLALAALAAELTGLLQDVVA